MTDATMQAQVPPIEARGYARPDVLSLTQPGFGDL